MKLKIILTLSLVLAAGIVLYQNSRAYPPAVSIVGKAEEGMIGNYFERIVRLRVLE
jgi:hypothetical protein